MENENIYVPDHLFVSGFKSIARDTTVGLRPLTLVSGPNSSGKSSLMQPFLLMKQTLDSTYDPGALLMDGPHIRFSDADQLLWCRRKDDSFVVGVGTEAYEFRVTFAHQPTGGFDIPSTTEVMQGEALTLKPGRATPRAVRRLPKGLQGLRAQVPDARWVVGRNRCFLDLFLELPKQGGTTLFTTGPRSIVENFFQSMIHVPAARTSLGRTFPVTTVGPFYSGPFQVYAASILNYWQERDAPELTAVNDAVIQLGLAAGVRARRPSDTEIRVEVARSPSSWSLKREEFVNIADVGFGMTQVLPVVVALVAALPGQLVYLEEPETHLHPSAQRALAGLITDAVQRGVRVLVETHSPLLLLSFQTFVADSSRPLSADDVILHWFSLDKRDGHSKIDTAHLDDVGSFGAWPEDFASTEMAAEHDYIEKSVERELLNSSGAHE